MQNFEKFKVSRIQYSDSGKNRIRIHHLKRNQAERYSVVRLRSKEGNQTLAVVLGHNEVPNVVFMDYDLRDFFNVHVGDTIELQIDRVGLCGRVMWYLNAIDPSVRVPAWLAFWSVVLGLLGLGLSIISISWCS